MKVKIYLKDIKAALPKNIVEGYDNVFYHAEMPNSIIIEATPVEEKKEGSQIDSEYVKCYVCGGSHHFDMGCPELQKMVNGPSPLPKQKIEELSESDKQNLIVIGKNLLEISKIIKSINSSL